MANAKMYKYVRDVFVSNHENCPRRKQQTIHTLHTRHRRPKTISICLQSAKHKQITPIDTLTLCTWRHWRISRTSMIHYTGAKHKQIPTIDTLTLCTWRHWRISRTNMIHYTGAKLRLGRVLEGSWDVLEGSRIVKVPQVGSRSASIASRST